MTEPADEFFPFQRDVIPNQPDQSGIMSLGPVQQLDLSVLQSNMSPVLSDPDGEFVSTAVVPRPFVAKQTVGPHRYTIYVPHDDASFINVGAARHPFAPGISMATKSNITLRTYVSTPETSLSLGAPSSIGGTCQTAGYAMDTKGASSSVATKDMSLASLENSLVLNAKQNINLSATGQVNLVGTGGVTTTAPAITLTATAGTSPEPGGLAKLGAWGLIALDVASTVAPLAGSKNNAASVEVGSTAASFLEDVGLNHAAALKTAYMAQASEVGTKILTHAATLTGLVVGFKKTFAQPEPGTSKWVTKAGHVKYVLDCLKEVASILKDTTIWAPPEESGAPTGIKLTSDTTIGLAAKGKVSINGDGGVAVTGGFGGVTLSGLSASLSGQTSAGLSSSLGASVKALAGDVSVSSDLREAKLSGKKDVTVTSEAGKVSVGSEQDAQITSKSGKAFVHGKTAAYVGAGKGSSFGMVAGTKKLEIGSVTPAETFGSAKGDSAKTMASFDGKEIKIQSTSDSKITVAKAGVYIKTKKAVTQSSGDIILKGSLIKLN